MATKQNAEKPLVVTSWVTQATVIIPLAIFISYSWSLSYEISFCKYFGIETYFILINSTTVLVTSIICAYILCAVVLATLTIFYILKFVIWFPYRVEILSMCICLFAFVF